MDEKGRLYASLGHATGRDCLRRALEFGMSDSVRSQDVRLVLAGVSQSSRDGAALAWRFFRERHAEFRRRYRQGPLMCNAVRAAAAAFGSTDEDADEVEGFFREHDFPGTDKTVSQLVEATR